ncbi:MAG TPA: 2Fe-2S iron-sulfur cluster-binding protein, partial [Blastocatellia bacterium]|nr:2Fe-2S iron-sulfur cluster-binding protein [Blastocatellia bacterium]
MRYRPEHETEPAFESFEVPLRKDWVVLDALNYIKDRLDGSLSYR